jgi:hypothetical protein
MKVLNIRTRIILFIAFKGTLHQKSNKREQWDLKPTRTNWYFTLKKLFPHILIIRGMSFKFDYPGEFEFILEKKLFRVGIRTRRVLLIYKKAELEKYSKIRTF